MNSNFSLYRFNITIITFISLLFSVSCQSEYTKLVKKELNSGVVYDHLLYDIKFGDTRGDFYQICWGLNQKGLVTHGPSNQYVQKILLPPDSLKTTDKIRMLFYATFTPNDTIIGMDMKFSYVAWAPWNKDYSSIKLLPRVKDSILKWFPGNPFIMVNKNVYVKVDGNRQIEMKLESERDVSVLIEDLSYKYNTLLK